jgi:hypothetical protein
VGWSDQTFLHIREDHRGFARETCAIIQSNARISKAKDRIQDTGYRIQARLRRSGFSQTTRITH